MSLLENLLLKIPTYIGETKDRTKQTDATSNKPISLSDRLARVQSKYESYTPNQHELNERMARYQAECDARTREEIDAQVAQIRQVELTRLRRQLTGQFQEEKEQLRNQFQEEYKQKYKEQMDRLEQERQRLHQQRRDLEQEQYESRQKILLDLGKLRERENELKRSSELDSRALEWERKKVQELEDQMRGRAYVNYQFQKEGLGTSGPQYKASETQTEGSRPGDADAESEVKAQDELQSLKESYSKLEKENEQLHSECEELRMELEDAKKKVSSVSSKNSEYEQTIQEKDNQLLSTERQLQWKLKKELEQLEWEKQYQQDQREREWKNAYSKLSSQIEDLKAERQELEERVSDARSNEEAARREVKELSRLLDAAKQSLREPQWKKSLEDMTNSARKSVRPPVASRTDPRSLVKNMHSWPSETDNKPPVYFTAQPGFHPLQQSQAYEQNVYTMGGNADAGRHWMAQTDSISQGGHPPSSASTFNGSEVQNMYQHLESPWVGAYPSTHSQLGNRAPNHGESTIGAQFSWTTRSDFSATKLTTTSGMEHRDPAEANEGTKTQQKTDWADKRSTTTSVGTDGFYSGGRSLPVSSQEVGGLRNDTPHMAGETSHPTLTTAASAGIAAPKRIFTSAPETLHTSQVARRDSSSSATEPDSNVRTTDAIAAKGQPEHIPSTTLTRAIEVGSRAEPESRVDSCHDATENTSQYGDYQASNVASEPTSVHQPQKAPLAETEVQNSVSSQRETNRALFGDATSAVTEGGEPVSVSLSVEVSSVSSVGNAVEISKSSVDTSVAPTSSTASSATASPTKGSMEEYQRRARERLEQRQQEEYAPSQGEMNMEDIALDDDDDDEEVVVGGVQQTAETASSENESSPISEDSGSSEESVEWF
eukprot:gb/GECG01015248.1/.p1 GENE.gb/GECG01015248.1/~~gb/GECG01015248.1/.p1  ORF type:complete len:888 (+),score=159.42 gb/GECG01015248.1/:1-2664(+)